MWTGPHFNVITPASKADALADTAREVAMKAAVQEQERLAAEAQAALDELIRDGVPKTNLVKF